MKNPSHIFLIALLGILGCETDEAQIAKAKDMENGVILQSIVSNAEYNKATALEREAVNMINGAIAALKGLSLNEKNASVQYIATFSIDADGKRDSYDYLAISLPDKATNARVKGGSCSVCGLQSGISCAKKIVAAVNENNGALVVTIKKNGSCYDVMW
jgi:hypothetical protein